MVCAACRAVSEFLHAVGGQQFQRTRSPTPSTWGLHFVSPTNHCFPDGLHQGPFSVARTSTRSRCAKRNLDRRRRMARGRIYPDARPSSFVLRAARFGLHTSHWKRRLSCLHLPGAGEWQRDFWDTRLRRSDNYTEKWHNVRENPVRAELVKAPEEWTFEGQIHVVPW